MNTLVAEYWIWLVAALVIGLIVAFYVFHASKRTSVSGTSRDVLDEGADRARRNQALIESEPAVRRDTALPGAEPAAAEPEAAEPGAAAVIAPVRTVPAAPASAAGAPAADTVPTPTPPDQATTAAAGDELTRIKGIGPKLAARLRELGITGIADIASWDDAEIDRLDPQLGRFQGRIRRDAWVEQARLLIGGETGSYEARFGRLD